VFWSLTSAFLWATTFVTVRPILSEGRVDPITLSLIGGVVLTGLGIGRRERAGAAP
jgi:drug/metabolite transporter (DMT)-like permease